MRSDNEFDNVDEDDGLEEAEDDVVRLQLLVCWAAVQRAGGKGRVPGVCMHAAAGAYSST
jgi:hypothetical protein